jgi:hypothetical protein
VVEEAQREGADQDEADEGQRNRQGGDRDRNMVRINVWDSRPSVVVSQSPVQDPGYGFGTSECGMLGRGKDRLNVRLSEKLGDIAFCPAASSISRYIPTLFVTLGRVLKQFFEGLVP